MARSNFGSRMTREPKRTFSRESSCWWNSSRSCRIGSQLLNRAQKVGLADFHSALAQQRIHHAFVEIEIGQHEIRQIGQRSELPGAIGKLDFNGAPCIAVDLGRRHRLEKVHSLRNPLLEL